MLAHILIVHLVIHKKLVVAWLVSETPKIEHVSVKGRSVALKASADLVQFGEFLGNVIFNCDTALQWIVQREGCDYEDHIQRVDAVEELCNTHVLLACSYPVAFRVKARLFPLHSFWRHLAVC